MRYVPLLDQEPDESWLKNAQDLLHQLDNAPNEESRKSIIEDNSKVWGKLKDWLLDLSKQKCWFSEAKDCFNHWDVEHYRPKKVPTKGYDSLLHHAYWWLAFDWRNLRICGNVGNRMKGAYFPLRPGCARCGRNDELRREEPLLLDPADPHDPALLSFNVAGQAIVAPSVKEDWEIERVERSIQRYKLDYGPLENKRKAVWADCWSHIKEYLDDLDKYHKDRTNDVAKDAFKRAARSIRRMLREDQEMTAVARACLLSTGDERLVDFLRAQ